MESRLRTRDRRIAHENQRVDQLRRHLAIRSSWSSAALADVFLVAERVADQRIALSLDFPSDYPSTFAREPETSSFYDTLSVKTGGGAYSREKSESHLKSRKHPLKAWIHVAVGAYWAFELVDLAAECWKLARKSRRVA